MLVFGSFEYRLERLVAVLSRFPKPNDHTTCFSINFCHALNLLCLLVIVVLIDANGIYPQDPVHKAILKVCQCCVKVSSNGDLAAVYFNNLLAVLRPPYVR